MMNRAQRVPQNDEEATEPGLFGCPMLTHLQWERAAETHVPTSRCLIGWSLTDDLAIARCRATHAVVDCWKAHPERTPIVVADHPDPIVAVLHAAAAD